MPADRTDLAARLAAATPADTSRGLNYATLFALVADHLGPGAAREVDVLGKGARVDFFSYPVTEYLQTAWNAVDRLEERLGGVEQVFHELGRRTIAGFLGSMIGRTVFAVSGRDPRKMLATAHSGYRAAVSYGERTIEWLGPRQARLTFRRDFMPAPFHRAVILTGLEASDCAAPRVEARTSGLLDTVYDVTWG